MAVDLELPGPRTRWHYRQVANWLGPLLLAPFGGLHVSGREHIPAEGPALICSNHISYLDPPLLGIAAVRRCCYMAKASLFTIPVLGWFIRKSYSYPVDRDEGGRQALRIATRLLEAGELVVIFPEGGRSPDGELMPGEPGAAYIAARTQVPLIPAAIWGTDIVMPRNTRRLYRCPMYVRFGPPMPPPALPEGGRISREQLQAVTDELMARIGNLRQEIIAEVPEKWRQRAVQLKARWREAQARRAAERDPGRALPRSG